MITISHKMWERVFIREGAFIRINTAITEIISAVIYWYVQYHTVCAESVFCF